MNVQTEKTLFTYAKEVVTKNYANFQGRARRKEYWGFTLFYMIFYILLEIVLGLAFGVSAGVSGSEDVALGGSVVATLILLVISLGLLIPSIAVAVRRLHDTDRSGWWMLIGLIPLIGAIVLFVFFCLDGTKGDNRFGADPKA